MGTTTSRPILHGIESFLLRIALIIDGGIRFVERLLTSIFSLCLPSSLYHDYPIDEGIGMPNNDKGGGVCLSSTNRNKEHAQFKHRYEERLKRRKLRAEWAAAGLDVIEMERQEQAKKKRQQQYKATIHQMSEKRNGDEMLGSILRAPELRLDQGREIEAAGRAPTKREQQSKLPKRKDKSEIRLPEDMIQRRAGVLESVRETSFYESPDYAIHGHGSRIASGVSEHGDISYQILATSRDYSESAAPQSPSIKAIPKPQHHLRKAVTSQIIMPSQTQAIVSDSKAPLLDAVAQKRQKGPQATPSSPPKIVQPTAQRHRRSIDLISLNNSLDQLSSPKQQQQQQQQQQQLDKKDPIDLRSDSPRFFNRARASLDMVTNAAAATMIQPSRPSSPSSPTMAPFSSTSSDAASITSRRSIFGSSSLAASISRSSTPPCLTDLADRACKSRWEASARERKVWKGEVDRIALHKLQQTNKRHRIHSQDKMPISILTESTNLVHIADRRIRRVSLESDQTNTRIVDSKAAKRRSFQRPPSRKDI